MMKTVTRGWSMQAEACIRTCLNHMGQMNSQIYDFIHYVDTRLRPMCACFRKPMPISEAR